MDHHRSPCAKAAALILLTIAPLLAATPLEDRIPRSFDENATAILHANTHPAVAARLAADLGTPSSSTRLPRLSLHFALTPAQQSDLDQLLTAQQNRRSPQFHKFLTPEQFADRFGLSPTDLDTVARWLSNHGFSNIQPARARTSITFSGTVAHAQSAFHTRIHKYSLDNETYLANTTDPQLPQALASITQHIGGLNNFRATPLSQPAQWQPRLNSQNCIPACNGVAPDDWQTIYNVKPLYIDGFDGTGVSIAVVGESDVPFSDLRAFRAAANLPAKDPTIVIPTGDTDPGILTGSGAEFEAYIDLEWANAIAKNANVIFVVASSSTGGVADALTYSIDQNIAPIVSVSFGFCESTSYASFFTTFNNLLAQANAQGMTIVAASGDFGPACNVSAIGAAVTQGFSASFPASSPYATAIGGSEFTVDNSTYWGPSNNGNGGSALSYIPETVWNDGQGHTSGGGASIFFSAPSWQLSPGLPNDGWRDFPDISFTASPYVNPVVVCASGSCVNGFFNANGYFQASGGTSVGTPAFASVLALLVQKTGAPLGNVNPNLYSLAQISSNIFNDITSGNNYQICTSGTPNCPNTGQIGFPALTGYDQATGWGSLDVLNFAEQWSGDIQLSASPASLTVAPGTSATSTVTVTPQNHFSGLVTLTCSVSSSLIDASCSIPSTPINTSGTAVVTITATKNAHTPPRLPRPPNSFWIALALLLSVTLLFRKRPVYLYGALVALTIGTLFVSCGGASASGGGSKTPSLSLSCSIPSVVPVNVAYTGGSCTAIGGTAPYFYGTAYGSLPPGLALNSNTGAITGTPNTPQATSFTMTVTDSGLPQQRASYAVPTFTVNATGPLTLICPSLQTVTVGDSINESCYANGATPPISYTISSGTLPPSLTFNPSTVNVANFSGTVTKAGNFAFTVKATDTSQPAQTAAQNFSVTVNPPPPLTSGWNSTQFGQAHVPVYQFLPVYGGLPPYSYSLTAGALPAGLTLSPSGTISGTPLVAGSSAFSVTVTDSYVPQQTVTAPATFQISPPPPESGTVTITAASGGIVNTTTITVSVPAP